MLCLLSNTPKIGYVAVDRYPEFLAGWVGAGGGGTGILYLLLYPRLTCFGPGTLSLLENPTPSQHNATIHKAASLTSPPPPPPQPLSPGYL